VVTIRDVAKVAGVSISSVSHVVNNTRFVSDETRKKVLAAMEELNYHPNDLARGLRRGETRTLGLIVPDNSNSFFAEVARGIENVGYENGYSVILCNSDGDIQKELAYVNVLSAKQVDGVIFIASGNQSDHIHMLTSRGIPVIVADRDIAEPSVDVVLVNNEEGGYQATRHLVLVGHKRIACIAGPSNLTPSADRVRGYQRALAEAGIPFLPELVVQGDFRYQGGEAAMHRLLALKPAPTAVFVCNDIMAIGSLRAIYSAGLRVPGQISIVGFDDIPLASAMNPSLSTVAQPVHEIASVSTTLLLEKMAARIQGETIKQEGRRIVLDPKLIIRESSAQLSS
jgi:LacI family transcriptional regulator